MENDAIYHPFIPSGLTLPPPCERESNSIRMGPLVATQQSSCWRSLFGMNMATGEEAFARPLGICSALKVEMWWYLGPCRWDKLKSYWKRIRLAPIQIFATTDQRHLWGEILFSQMANVAFNTGAKHALGYLPPHDLVHIYHFAHRVILWRMYHFDCKTLNLREAQY